MPKAVVNKFDGGHAEDVRTYTTDQCEKSTGLDAFSNPHKLLPYRDTVTETVSSGTITDFEMSGLVFDGSLYWTVGRVSSGSAVPQFFYKASITANWQAGNTGPAGSTVIKGTLVLYKGVVYTLAYNSSNQHILVNSSGTSVTTITGSTVANAPLTYTPRPFVHPSDNVLYMALGKVLASYNGSAWSESATILPLDATPTSLTSYGDYLAVSLIQNNKSIVVLWGRDLTLNTLQANIPFGEGKLLILENIGNQLVGISITPGTLANGSLTSIDVRVYGGGSAEIVKSLSYDSAISNYGNYKTTYLDGIYFGFGGQEALFVVKKNKSGYWTIAQDRYIYNGTTIGSAVPIPTILDGMLWVAFSTLTVVGQFYRNWVSSESNTYNATTIRRTTINPGMAIEDRDSIKQLDAVEVTYTGAATGITVLKYSVDGSTFTTVISATNATGEQAAEAACENNGAVFLSGREIQFQAETTGGAKVKEIKYRYSILNSLV